MPRPASIAFLAWLAGVGPLVGQTSESHFEIVPLAEGVYAALQPDRLRFYESETGQT